MRQRIVNGRWNLWVPDSIADWDAPSGDYSARRGWEFERFESLKRWVHHDDLLIDVGAEHGWISAIISREICPNLILVEPSAEFWWNIRKTWEYNGLVPPIATAVGFAGHTTTDGAVSQYGWPAFLAGQWADHPEIEAMAYRSLSSPGDISTFAVDDLATHWWDPVAEGRHLHLNIDVEGAEMEVLRGAAQSLADHKFATVHVSIHPDLMVPFGTTREEVVDYMAGFGYRGEHLGTDHEEHHLFRPVER